MTKKKPGKRGIEKIVPWWGNAYAAYAAYDFRGGWSVKESYRNLVTGKIDLVLVKTGNTTEMLETTNQ